VDAASFHSFEELEKAHKALLAFIDAQHVQPGSAGSTSPSTANRDEVIARNLQRIREFLQQGSATGRHLDSLSERMNAQAMLDQWATRIISARIELGVECSLADFDEAAAPTLADKACPYVGLDPFGEGDQQLFFGREKRVEALVELVRGKPIVFVAGASGSGKSSLIFAGLIPRLRLEAKGGPAWDVLPTIVPGAEPLRGLAKALAARAPAMQESAIAQQMLTDAGCANRLLQAADRPALLVLDQFEELFTLKSPETSAQFDAFIANLLQIAQPGSRHRVVVTLRKDREGDLANNADLQELYFGNQFIVTAMLPGQLTDAIERPAQRVGLKYDDGVVKQLVQTFTGDDAALPLLQFCLVELWGKRRRNRVKGEALAALGDPKLAMAKVADEVFDGLLEQNRRAAQMLFLSLARHVGGQEYVRQRRLRCDLWAAAGNKLTVDDVIKRFAERRLLRITPVADDPSQDVVEVAHEALLRNWNWFSRWAAEKSEDLKQHAFISELAKRWMASSGRSVSTQAASAPLDETGLLLSGLALNQALEMQGAFPEGSLERHFLAESQHKTKALEAQRSELQRGKIAGLIMLTIILLGVLAVLANTLYDKVVQARHETAKRAAVETKAMAAEALQACEEDTQQSLAKVTYVRSQTAAHKLSMPGDANSAAYCMMRGQARSVRHLAPELTGDVRALAMSRDGKRLATASDSTVKEWNADSVQLLRTIDRQAAADLPVSAIEYDATGELLAIGYGVRRSAWDDAAPAPCPPNQMACGAVAVWRKSEDKPSLTLAAGAVSHLVFSPNAKYLAALMWGNGRKQGAPARGEHWLRVWSLDAPGAPVLDELLPGRALQVSFSPDYSAPDLWLMHGDGKLSRYSPQQDRQYKSAGDPFEPECPTTRAFAIGPGRYASTGSKTCAFSLQGNRGPRQDVDLDGTRVRDVALRGPASRYLVSLEGARGEFGDIAIRDLTDPDREPIVLRKQYNLDSGERTGCHAPLRASPELSCDDFDPLVQISDDATKVALKRLGEGVRILTLSQDPTLGWWPRLIGEVSLSQNGNILAALVDRPEASSRATSAEPQRKEYQVRLHDLLSAQKIADAKVSDLDSPVIRMVDREGANFLVTDNRRVELWRRQGNTIEQTRIADTTAWTVQMSSESSIFALGVAGKAPACSIHRLGQAEVLLRVEGRECRVSSSGRYAAALSAGTLNVYDLSDPSRKPRWNLKVAEQIAARLAGEDTPFVVLMNARTREHELHQLSNDTRFPSVLVGRYQPSGILQVFASRKLVAFSSRVQGVGRTVYRFNSEKPLLTQVIGISPSGKLVATRTESGIRIHDTDSAEPEKALTTIGFAEHESTSAPQIEFSRDDSWVALIKERKVDIHQLPAGKHFVTLPIAAEDRFGPRRVAFTADGQFVVIRSGNKAFETLPLARELIETALRSKVKAYPDIATCLEKKDAAACKRVGLATADTAP
jgi:hypothetical protein